MNDLIGKENHRGTNNRLDIGQQPGTEWNALIGGYLPHLKRFAMKHLPVQLHGTMTPDDLVQEVVLSGLRQLPRLELLHERAFLSVFADINPPSHRGRGQKEKTSAGLRFGR